MKNGVFCLISHRRVAWSGVIWRCKQGSRKEGMNYAKAYRICVRLGAFIFLLMVGLMSYAAADHATHRAWLGIFGLVAIGLAIRPLYFWLLNLPQQYP